MRDILFISCVAGNTCICGVLYKMSALVGSTIVQITPKSQYSFSTLINKLIMTLY